MAGTVLSRRDVLRRGAITGGALIWAVPTVQVLAGPAFAGTVGSPDPNDPVRPGLSYLALIVERVSPSASNRPQRLKAKFEIGGGWTDPGPGPNNGANGSAPIGIPSCETVLPDWRAARPLDPAASDFPFVDPVQLQTTDGDVTRAEVVIPDGWLFVEGAGKAATSCGPAGDELNEAGRRIAVFTSPEHVDEPSADEIEDDVEADIQATDEGEPSLNPDTAQSQSDDVAAPKATEEPTEASGAEPTADAAGPDTSFSMEMDETPVGDAEADD